MFSWLKQVWRKAFPSGLLERSGGQLTIDAYRRRAPTNRELLDELKSAVYTCATLNASACASHQPKLYVRTSPGEMKAVCPTRPLSALEKKSLLTPPPGSPLPDSVKSMGPGVDVAEVTQHPLLELFRQVNPVMNCFDLWELTTLYQEVFGSAYWYLEPGPFGPANIWPLPTQNVTPFREKGSENLVDWYVYRSGASEQRFRPDEVIHFYYPDPRDPYSGRGLSPLRATFEQARLASEFAAFRTSKITNQALPDAILSPDEVIGEEERTRLEREWNSKLRRGGAGRVIVGESGLKVNLLNHSISDLALLADVKATREDVANAFGIPIAYLTSVSNLANLQASKTQHAETAIRPRIWRRDQKLNEALIPLYDTSGRLFLATPDPVPEDRQFALQRRNSSVQLGIMTIDEARAELGLPPMGADPSVEGKALTGDGRFRRGLNWKKRNTRRPAPPKIERPPKPNWKAETRSLLNLHLQGAFREKLKDPEFAKAALAFLMRCIKARDTRPYMGKQDPLQWRMNIEDRKKWEAVAGSLGTIAITYEEQWRAAKAKYKEDRKKWLDSLAEQGFSKPRSKPRKEREDDPTPVLPDPKGTQQVAEVKREVQQGLVAYAEG